MASPFKFFRKYSSGMMIVMVILSMLLFTLDSLFSDTSANLWLLGLLAGGAIFGIAGVGQGRWLQWGLGGAALGAVLGFVLPGFVEDGGLSTSLGVIDEEEMFDLEMRRSIANQFVLQASEAVYGEQFGRQFARLFGFGHQTNREDVIFGKLMRAEADRIGITVNRDMINDHLKKITSEMLTEDQYVNIRNSLSYNRKSMNDNTLFAILGDEVKAQLAYLTLSPRTAALPPGPEVYWQYFRRLNVRQQLNTVALDVGQFVDQVGEPPSDEVDALFDQFQSKFPNQDGPGTPGFRLDFRAKLAFLELDYASMEASAEEITDADIEAYYEENKETPMIRTPKLPDTPDDTESELGESTEAATPPSADEKPEAEETEKPAPDPADTKDDTPQAPPEEAEQPKEEKSAATPEQTPAEKAPEKADSESAAVEEQTEADDSCGPFEADESTAAANEKTDPPATEKPASPPENGADDKSTDSANAEPANEPAAPPTQGDSPVGDATDTQPGLTIPEIPALPEKADSEVEEIEYEYRPLDDDLKTEIREEILRQRVSEAIDTKMTAAVAQMETLARERSTERFSHIEKDPARFEGRAEEQVQALKELREQMKAFDAKLNARLKKYAEDNGFKYVETQGPDGLVSYREFLNEEDYPISSATRPNDNPMLAAQSPNVASTVFQTFSNDEQSNDAQLFLVRRAQRRALDLNGSESHYAHWAIDFSVSHVPEIDEKGVRESVELAWKRMKARELVIKRGEELAEIVRKGLEKFGEEKPDMEEWAWLEEWLKDETATGTEDGAALAVRNTLPFSWLRTSSAPQMNLQRPQVSMSPIQYADEAGGSLEMAGDKFMSSVFEDLTDEKVGVVPNADLSKYYVVQVTNRFPTPDIGEDNLREKFLTEGKQFAFSQSAMIGVMQQQLGGPPSIAWEKKVWLRYGVDPDGEPEE
ncbi:MAG: hypothetical protein P8J37_19660 [Fuerstiella sp.]|nr:hypothetical protein [Fuerstiella sp.]